MKRASPLVLAAAALLVFPGLAGADGPGETGQRRIVVSVAKKTADLDWLMDHGSLFTATREDFEKQYEKGSYAWLDKEKTRARFNPDRTEIRLRGAESGETIVSFREDRIHGVMISVMNKGDDGYIKATPYQSAIRKARETLSKVANVAEAPRKKNETVSKADGLVWSTRKAMYMLEYLWVPEERRDGYIWYAHGEFVRIRILPPQVLLGVQQNTLKTDISRPTLAKRVKREGSRVFLDGLPMVDQGSKGYCAVASFERVMRYYGSQVDMHDLADLANTSSFGTSPEGIKDAVHKMAVRTGLRTREPIFMQTKDFISMRNAYNRVAKKQKIDTIESGSGLMGLYREMDPDVCKSMRLKDSGYSKFATEVSRSINAGIPVMWALQLGMFWEDGLEDSYEANREGDSDEGDSDEDTEESADSGDSDNPPGPEPVPQRTRPARPPESMSGGHMRIIVGYDPKEKLILYTDSWGPGHEMKKMNIEDAWTVTMGLFIVEP